MPTFEETLKVNQPGVATLVSSPQDGGGLGASVPLPPIPAGAHGAILVAEGADKGLHYTLGNDVVTIGRGPDNSVTLNDPGVSTYHCQIGYQGGRCILQDKGSRNGCYVNNQRVQHQVLATGDVLVFGSTRVVVNLH